MAVANPTNLSDEDPTIMCDPCSFRGINTPAGTYCHVCSENLCDTCEVVHQSFKATRDHELKPFEESHRLSIKQKALISSIMVCDIHRTETVRLFCVNHNIAVCNVCNTMKHRKCDTQALKQISKDANKRNDVFQCTEQIKTLLSDSKDIEHTREEDKKMIETCSRKCIQEVKKIKQQIIACAVRLEKDMDDKILNAKNKLFIEIESDIKAVVEISKQMERLVSSFESLGQDIEDATLVLMMKEKGNIEDGIELKDDLLKQGKQVTLEFKESDQLVTLLSEITSMGRLEVKEKQINNYETSKIRENQLSFKAISSTTNKIVTDVRNVGGCVFMPDGEIVICGDNSVKVFTPEFKLKNEITIGSRIWDVAVVSKNEVIVTQLDLNSLHFLTLSNGIEKGKCIPIGMKCRGVDCKNEKLYVSCEDGNLEGGIVKVLTMDGVSVNTFNISQGYPYFLAVNSSGDRLLVSTFTNGVLCIDNTGKTLFTYSNSQLEYSRGLLFDSYDNFMVCGQATNNIHVVKSDGTKHKIILTKDDGLKSPFCLAYRHSDNTLIVGEMQGLSLLAFTIK